MSVHRLPADPRPPSSTRFRPLLAAASGILLPAVALAVGPMTLRDDGVQFPDGSVQTSAVTEPRIPVQSLPGSPTAVHVIDQPGSYYLEGAVIGEAAKNGIEIASDDVTLDLMGFGVFGVTGSESGIVASGSPRRVTVRNGFVSGWDGHGVSLPIVQEARVEGIVAAGNASLGIWVGNGIVVDSQAFKNLVGIQLDQGSIVRCLARENTDTGMSIGGNGGGLASEVIADLNGGRGLSQSAGGGWRIENSVFTRNGNHGLDLCNRNTVRNNTASSNGTDSLVADGAGIHLRCGGNVVDGNVVEGNDVGIRATATGVDVVIRNFAAGNVTNYDQGSNNDFGPISTAAVATSPWANIEN